MVLARSNRDIDLKNAVGNYELALTPRVLFGSDESILPCTDKSKLIHYLEMLGKNPMKTTRMHKHQHLRKIIMNRKHLQHPLRVKKLLLWMEWCSSSRWQRNLGQSAETQISANTSVTGSWC